MSRVPVWALSMLAAVAAFALAAHGQAVISTHSGLVHYFEGAVSVAAQPLEAHLGKFASVPDGAELRTERGRAEVLLTPGVFLRVGENSAIRMVSSALQDTRVELLAGSSIVEAGEPAPGTSVTLIYKDWSIRLPQKGLYRFDCEPPRFEVRAGEAQVSAAGDASVTVGAGMVLPFAAVLAPEKLSAASGDALTDWADGRAQSISADNSIAADIQDPATMAGTGSLADGFTYFPMLGLSAFGYGPSYQTGLYGSSGLYQPGFYSIYLPGYAYLPSFMRLTMGGWPRTIVPLMPSHIGIAPSRVGPITPMTHGPAARPVTPPPIPRGGVHVGGHR
jgi:hypothetical protein